MYPGIFIQTVVSFILSIAIMFMVGESINSINTFYNKGNKKSESSALYLNLGYILVIITFVALVGWNIKEIINPSEEEVTPSYFSPRFNSI